MHAFIYKHTKFTSWQQMKKFALSEYAVMPLIETLKYPSAKWDREQPAPESAIKNLIEQAGIELPEDYIAFLRYSNGGEGELGIQPWWFRIWAAEEVIEANRNYEVHENIPGFFGIA